MSKFIQIHTLTSYPGALLNRDDVGFAKRLPLGGATRTRISSQCLKRHWRTHEGPHALHSLVFQGKEVGASVRSRLAFERFVCKPLVDKGVSQDIADAVTTMLMDAVLGKSEKAKSADGKPKKAKKDDTEKTKEREPLQTNQVVVLGRPELDFLVKLADKIVEEGGNEKAFEKVFDKEQKKNLKELSLGAGLGAALFGRMVTSDILARGDAAIHVAHAFTVHNAEVESDYFSAIDDLVSADGELGSGHINSTELTSGLYYGYVVVDVGLLTENLSGDAVLASAVVERLVHLIATVSPGAKLGSTAPYANASFVMVEKGDAQPRTLANAFLKPVSERPDLLENSFKAINDFVEDDESMYGKLFERSLAARGPKAALKALGEGLQPLAEVAKFASSGVAT